MTKGDFCKAVAAGRGGAILHVQEHGAAGLEHAIRRAVLRNQQVTAQFEDLRGDYLLRLLAAAGMTEAMVPCASEMLVGKHWADRRQRIDVVALLAERGNEACGVALRDAFERSEEPWDFRFAITGLGGSTALAELLRRSLPAELTEHFYAIDEFFYNQGVPPPTDDSPVSVRLRRLLKTRHPDRVRRSRPIPHRLSPEQIAEERAAWARRFEQETDTAALDRLKGRLGWRPYPEPLDAVVARARTFEDEWWNPFVFALKKTRHPLVRRLALDFLKDRDRWFWALDLLVANHRAGDEHRVRVALDAFGDERSLARRHRVQKGLHDLAKRRWKGDWGFAWEWSYREGPCSWCREYLVSDWIERGTMPRELIEECLEDAVADTRNVAAKALGLPLPALVS